MAIFPYKKHLPFSLCYVTLNKSIRFQILFYGKPYLIFLESKNFDALNSHYNISREEMDFWE